MKFDTPATPSCGTLWDEQAFTSATVKIHYGAIAQLVERLTRTHEVSGSTPLSSTPSLLRFYTFKNGLFSVKRPFFIIIPGAYSYEMLPLGIIGLFRFIGGIFRAFSQTFPKNRLWERRDRQHHRTETLSVTLETAHRDSFIARDFTLYISTVRTGYDSIHTNEFGRTTSRACEEDQEVPRAIRRDHW